MYPGLIAYIAAYFRTSVGCLITTSRLALGHGPLIQDEPITTLLVNGPHGARDRIWTSLHRDEVERMRVRQVEHVWAAAPIAPQMAEPRTATAAGNDERSPVNGEVLVSMDVPRKECSRLGAFQERFNEVSQNDLTRLVPTTIGERRMMPRYQNVLDASIPACSRERRTKFGELTAPLRRRLAAVIGIDEQ